jgi:hypothetical protein
MQARAALAKPNRVIIPQQETLAGVCKIGGAHSGSRQRKLRFEAMKTILSLTLLLTSANTVMAQFVRDFYNRGGVALYNPEIALAYTGVMLDARPVVSADRKYVTIGVRTEISRIVSMDTFPVAQGVVGGFVGGIAGGNLAGGPTGGPAGVDFNASSPVQIRFATLSTVFNHTGMIWLAPP